MLIWMGGKVSQKNCNSLVDREEGEMLPQPHTKRVFIRERKQPCSTSPRDKKHNDVV